MIGSNLETGLKHAEDTAAKLIELFFFQEIPVFAAF
jgi:hypothetical protein